MTRRFPGWEISGYNASKIIFFAARGLFASTRKINTIDLPQFLGPKITAVRVTSHPEGSDFQSVLINAFLLSY